METIDKLMTSAMYQDALKEITEKTSVVFFDYDSTDSIYIDMIEENLKLFFLIMTVQILYI